MGHVFGGQAKLATVAAASTVMLGKPRDDAFVDIPDCYIRTVQPLGKVTGAVLVTHTVNLVWPSLIRCLANSSTNTFELPVSIQRKRPIDPPSRFEIVVPSRWRRHGAREDLKLC